MQLMTFIYLVAYHFLFATYSNLAYVTFIFYLYSLFFYSPRWSFVLQTETLGKYNALFYFCFLSLFFYDSCCRQDQFTVLSFTIWKKKLAGMIRRGKKFCLDTGFYLNDCLDQIMVLGAISYSKTISSFEHCSRKFLLHGGTLGTSAVMSQNAPKLSLSSPLKQYQTAGIFSLL